MCNIISMRRGVTRPKTGLTHYHAQLGLQDKSCTKGYLLGSRAFGRSIHGMLSTIPRGMFGIIKTWLYREFQKTTFSIVQSPSN